MRQIVGVQYELSVAAPRQRDREQITRNALSPKQPRPQRSGDIVAMREITGSL